MVTIIEDYVSFETAKLLKEKGFDFNAEYESYYTLGGVVVYFKDNTQNINIAPRITLQMAMKWLREVHNIFIENCITKNQNGKIDHWCKVNTINDLTPMSDKHPFNVFIVDSKNSCGSFEKAVEAAIKYSLKNLI